MIMYLFLPMQFYTLPCTRFQGWNLKYGGVMLKVELCYSCWTNQIKVVSTFDRVDKGVTRLCKLNELRLMKIDSN